LNIIAIIPARYKSHRLHGKLLKKLGTLNDTSSKTVIEYVYDNVKNTNLFKKVIVATDDERIREKIRKSGGYSVMTSSHHQSGTDRIAEVARQIDCEIIVNVQGDEPFINKTSLEKLISAFTDKDVDIATLGAYFNNDEEIENPNSVKIVLDKDNYALYFSRAKIPYDRENSNFNSIKSQVSNIYIKHIGVYGFRRDILLKLVKLPMSQLERIEKLEQLRWLENGYKIKVVITEYNGISIDTEHDLKKARMIV